MAKLEITDYDGVLPTPTMMAKVTLSQRNLLALLHKLDMPGSARRLENNVVYLDGELSDSTILVLCCENDDEHYADPARLGGPPGEMHPDTEEFVRNPPNLTEGA
jgi:hypothetical protein